MAFSTTSFNFPQSWVQVIQFLIVIWQMSCLTLSSHLYLGLPCDLLVRGFHLDIFLTVLVSGILCTWPNQLRLWALIWLTTFLCFISLSNSLLVLILHIWFSFVGPHILLKNSAPMFLRRTSLLVLWQFCIILSLNYILYNKVCVRLKTCKHFIIFYYGSSSRLLSRTQILFLYKVS